MSETNQTPLSKEVLELRGIKLQKDKIEEAYRQVFPKVDPYLLHDVYLRMREDPSYKDVGAMYTVEVFTKEGTDSEATKRHIMSTTGMAVSIYDNGTHYVTQMRLTPEILKKLNDFDNVLEIMGDYNGTDASQGVQSSYYVNFTYWSIIPCVREINLDIGRFWRPVKTCPALSETKRSAVEETEDDDNGNDNNNHYDNDDNNNADNHSSLDVQENKGTNL